MKRKTQEDFIRQSVEVHGDTYDLRNTVYVNSVTKVTVSCREHGTWSVLPYSFLQGSGCPECGKVLMGKTRRENLLASRYKGLNQPEEYKLVPLSSGKFAMVDNEDFDKVSGINWSFSKKGDAWNATKGKMHRFIMNASDGSVVDHINHDPLDNRRSNLRVCTQIQNMYNTKPVKGSISKYKGVSRNSVNSKWFAQICKDGKNIYLGSFDNEVDAAKARDVKAKELFGEYAYLNFPDKL